MSSQQLFGNKGDQSTITSDIGSHTAVTGPPTPTTQEPGGPLPRRRWEALLTFVLCFVVILNMSFGGFSEAMELTLYEPYGYQQLVGRLKLRLWGSSELKEGPALHGGSISSLSADDITNHKFDDWADGQEGAFYAAAGLLVVGFQMVFLLMVVSMVEFVTRAPFASREFLLPLTHGVTLLFLVVPNIPLAIAQANMGTDRQVAVANSYGSTYSVRVTKIEPDVAWMLPFVAAPCFQFIALLVMVIVRLCYSTSNDPNNTDTRRDSDTERGSVIIAVHSSEQEKGDGSAAEASATRPPAQRTWAKVIGMIVLVIITVMMQNGFSAPVVKVQLNDAYSYTTYAMWKWSLFLFRSEGGGNYPESRRDILMCGETGTLTGAAATFSMAFLALLASFAGMVWELGARRDALFKHFIVAAQGVGLLFLVVSTVLLDVAVKDKITNCWKDARRQLVSGSGPYMSLDEVKPTAFTIVAFYVPLALIVVNVIFRIVVGYAAGPFNAEDAAPPSGPLEDADHGEHTGANPMQEEYLHGEEHAFDAQPAIVAAAKAHGLNTAKSTESLELAMEQANVKDPKAEVDALRTNEPTPREGDAARADSGDSHPFGSR